MSSYVSHKIVDLEYIPFSLPRSKPMKMASFALEKSDFLLLMLKLADGTVGYGEVALHPILGTTIEGAAGAIDSYLKPVIVGKDVFDIDNILMAMDKVIDGNTPVKCGVDLAILDAQGKVCNLPICNLLGGCYREEADVEWATGIAAPEVMAEKAKKAYYEDGYRVMELKGGGDPEQDIAAIRLTKEAIPHKDMKLKMDFNEGYSVAVAIKTLKKIEQFDLVLYEQPVPGWDLDGLAAVTKAVDTPVMADEALRSEGDLFRIIEKHAADIVHVKPCRAGGLIKARRILKMAKAAGLEVTVGPYMCTGLGLAGSHQLIASVPKLFRDDHYGFNPTTSVDIITTAIMEKDAKVKFRMGPGVGVDIDFNKVEKYRVNLGK